MLTPLRANASRQSTSRVKKIKPPWDGWNARDSLEAMTERDAIVLDNMIATDGGIITRNGCAEHATGMGEPVTSLMAYQPQTGASKLFSATVNDVWDATSQGAVGAAAITGLANGEWQDLVFSTPGNDFLCMVNGADGYYTYNGTTWTDQSAAVTGVTASDFIHIAKHGKRLWFTHKNSLKVSYLPTNQITGAASTIDFGGEFEKGGHMVGMAAWTRDGGDGMDDLAVFLTSQGEVLVYQGIDPASASTWAKVGLFKIARPIGRRCFIRAGADLGILTELGVVPLSSVLALAKSGQARVAATAKVGLAFQASFYGGASLKGWSVTEYSTDRLIIINIPMVEGSSQVQYVMYVGDAKIKWSRWTNLNAGCWAQRDGSLYFGSNDGRVMLYTGTTDEGNVIEQTIVQAFVNLGTDNEKILHRIRPQFFGPPGYEPALGLRFDYDENVVAFGAQPYTAIGPEWDVSAWDVTDWGTARVASNVWSSVDGKGTDVAVLISFSTSERVTYNGCKVQFEVGDGV
jgi:hypothetical protein